MILLFLFSFFIVVLTLRYNNLFCQSNFEMERPLETGLVHRTPPRPSKIACPRCRGRGRRDRSPRWKRHAKPIRLAAPPRLAPRSRLLRLGRPFRVGGAVMAAWDAAPAATAPS